MSLLVWSRRALLGSVLIWMPVTAMAQSGGWSNPDASRAETAKRDSYTPWNDPRCNQVDPVLLNELSEMIRTAQRDRAASPDFLADLREFEQKLRRGGVTPTPINPAPDWGWSDDFSDGDYTSDPRWSVLKGDWTIDRSYGLRPIEARLATTQQQQRPLTPEEMLLILMGQKPGTATQPQANTVVTDALIERAVDMGNAIQVDFELADHAGTGSAHIILRQNGDLWPGYRLEIRGGKNGRIVLSKRARTGYVDLGSVQVSNTTGIAKFSLIRSPRGGLFVSVNGRRVISANDATFRGDWNGLAFFVNGGDYSVRRISAQPYTGRE